MKVQFIPSGYNQARVNSFHLGNSTSNRVATNPSKANISFGDIHYYDKFYVYKNFDPMSCTDWELDNLAEICHLNASDAEYAINERYTNGFLGLFASEAAEKRRISKDRLMPRIEKVKAKRANLSSKLSEYKSLNALGGSNIDSQKDNVRQQFIKPLEIATANNFIIPTNGIILYGRAKKSTKADFAKWIASETSNFGVCNTTVRYMPHNDEQSFELIKKSLEDAKSYYQRTGRSSIIHVENIDKLLTNSDYSVAGYVNEFKALAENASRKYHAILLVKTNQPLSAFRTDINLDKYFGLKVDLASGITPEQKKEMEAISREIDRLNRKANQSSDYFEWKTEIYDDDWYGSIAEQIGR